MSKKFMILAMAGALGVAGCVDSNTGEQSRRNQGAVIGAATGAAVGAATGSGPRLGRAAIGGVLGGIVGGVIGDQLDRQAAELRNDLPPTIGVNNYGDYLLVNMPSALLFATDSASVSPHLTRDLQTVAASLLRYPNSSIQVVGHTDNTGSASHNQTLSERRAASVASILIQSGVPAFRIRTIGRGENQPIATNLTPEGRAQNRRVEILIRPNQN